MEGAPQVLPTYPRDRSAKAERLVTKLGVEVRTNVRVVSVEREGVTFQTGDEISSVLRVGGQGLPLLDRD